MATSQVSGTGPASAIAQAGGAGPPSNAITAGQSFSNVNDVSIGLLSVALGSMGAGGTGGSFAYHTSVNLTLNAIGGPLLVDLLGNTSVGTGFDSATFQIKSNSNILDNEVFTDLASAQSFFSNNLLFLPILAGLNDIQMTFDAMMSGGQGFGFNYAVAGIAQNSIASKFDDDAQRPCNVWSARLAQEAEGCLARLIKFGLVGCTFLRAFDKFPLKSLWRIHHQQHLDLLGQSVR